MRDSKLTIGSLQWRIVNYGALATIKYLLHYLSRDIYRRNNNLVEIQNLTHLAQALEMDNFAEVAAEISEIVSIQSFDLKSRHQSNYKDVVSDNAYSLTRLEVLSLCILRFKPQVIFETGTQHGLSSSIISLTLKKYNIAANFLSFDLLEHDLLDASVDKNRKILKTPARKNYKKITSDLADGTVLFFHDSDHSYENMKFELHWAWNDLGATIVVSDDIDGNKAFLKFCNKFKAQAFRLKFDKGPAVGLAIRRQYN